MSGSNIEKGMCLTLDFKKVRKVCEQTSEDVIPVVVQDITTKEVLILAYVSEEALQYSLRNKVAAFWSTSRNELWVKGLTSGNVLTLVEVKVNCEQNSLLYLVKLDIKRGACHVKNDEGKYEKSCFYRKISKNGKKILLINKGE